MKLEIDFDLLLLHQLIEIDPKTRVKATKKMKKATLMEQKEKSVQLVDHVPRGLV